MTTDELVEEIVVRCRQRIERGEDVDSDEVVRAHPELAEKLRESFAALRKLDAAFGRRGPDDDAERPSLAGCLLGPYRLVSVLGSGGMGTVYLATVEDKAPGLDVGARVAVKVLHPHLFARRGYFKRFLREAELGRRVRHENVVRTLDVDEVGAARMLVMEYVEGQTLRSLADELGRVPEELCRHVGREVAKALAAVHDAGAVHRDVKPDNLIITRDNAVKLMDLGVARLADEAARLSQTGAFVGSVSYASPEQFQKGGADVDGRADLYALGLTLYELATGEHPFAADDFHVVLRRQMAEAPRPAGGVNPQVSPLFEALLAQLLEKDRGKRPANAAAVAEILEQGEESAWWKERAKAIREETKRPLRRIRIPRETALYGRDAELARLRSLYERASAGEGQVALIEGEAGIGKSRLVDEFVGQLLASGEEVNYLFGSYPPGGAATASGAFTTAYREHFGDEALETTLARYLTVTPILVPAFAALLRGEPPPEGKEPLSKDSLQTVFVHATRALAAERTTVVLIDDLHFAPQEGRALFASLALAVPGHRVLLVGCTRPGLDEKWIGQLARHPHATQIAVPRLGPKELVHLLRDALKSERLAEELAALIAVKSDGNPFFVFEMLRGLKEGQFLAQRPDGTWHTTQVVRSIQVPSSILDLVQARVADLATAERDLLDVAACCGFEFDPVLVATARGAGRIPTLKSLAQIERAHRLVRSSGRRFVFDHHQVQEALYGSIPEMLREEYHAAIAEAIEAQHDAAAREPKDLDGAVCVELAEHFFMGAQGERAVRYLDAALTHLESSYLNEAAIRLADHALAIQRLLVGVARTNTLLRLGNRLNFLGLRQRQIATIEEALASARSAGDRSAEARAVTNLGIALHNVGRFSEAREHHQRALAVAREIGDRRVEAAANGNLGDVLRSLGRYIEAREHTLQHLALAQELGDQQGEATASGNLGLVLWSLGLHAQAREHHERHLALARAIHYLPGEATATGNLGVVCFSLGRFVEAREHHERHAALAREVGDRLGEVVAMGNLGAAAWVLDRPRESRECFERQLSLALEIGNRQRVTSAMVNLGTVLGWVGHISEALQTFERCLAEVREMGDRRLEGYTLGVLAWVESESGNAGSADRLYTESLEIRRSIAARGDEAESLLDRGALRSRLGRSDEARADLEAALAIARALSLPAVELRAAASLAAQPGGDIEPALAALALHESGVETRVATEVRFILWKATRDRAHLAEAKRLLDHLICHAPAEDRGSMLSNVRLHREIAEAAAAAGL